MIEFGIVAIVNGLINPPPIGGANATIANASATTSTACQFCQMELRPLEIVGSKINIDAANIPGT